MISNKNIMVYYHCYDIVSEASCSRPELFYKYWNTCRNLLHYENSYHRDIGLTMIANLSKSDENNLILEVIDEYLEHAQDDKFMTSRCCIKNSSKILLNKPELMKKIIVYFINLADNCNYPIKQKELLISDIIEAFDTIYDKYENSHCKAISGNLPVLISPWMQGIKAARTWIRRSPVRRTHAGRARGGVGRGDGRDQRRSGYRRVPGRPRGVPRAARLTWPSTRRWPTATGCAAGRTARRSTATCRSSSRRSSGRSCC